MFLYKNKIDNNLNYSLKNKCYKKYRVLTLTKSVYFHTIKCKVIFYG